jgi:glucose-1-phosphate cytidylyltransferase
MKTLILAGGYGTRIRDVTDDIPKPMIPIGNHPILWHIMKGYRAFNIKDFVLCLGYKSDIIKDYFLNYHNRQSDLTLDMSNQKIAYHGHYSEEDWRVTFAETGINTQTGARIFRAKKYIEKDDHFMLTYGDGVGDVDIEKLLTFHKSHGKLMTVTGARPPGRFGELKLDEDQVVGFNEKPQATEGWVSAGFFVCSRQVLDYLSPDEDLIFEREPITNIVKDNQLMVYKHTGFWHPMDTSRDYHLLNQIWNTQQAPWKLWS